MLTQMEYVDKIVPTTVTGDVRLPSFLALTLTLTLARNIKAMRATGTELNYTYQRLIIFRSCVGHPFHIFPWSAYPTVIITTKLSYATLTLLQNKTGASSAPEEHPSGGGADTEGLDCSWRAVSGVRCTGHLNKRRVSGVHEIPRIEQSQDSSLRTIALAVKRPKIFFHW